MNRHSEAAAHSPADAQSAAAAHSLADVQFGATAANYLTSSVHAAGTDLDRVVTLAAALQPRHALDLGCGAGHVSFALARGGARQVTAYDLAPRMLQVVAAAAATRGHRQITTLRGPAEQLPFPDAHVDLVISRYSAHHWLDLPAALAEVVRVLVPGGRFVMIDVLAPAAPLLDTVLQAVELLRDLSHVRDYRESEWRALFKAAGLSDPIVDRWKLPLEFASWVARSATPPARIEALKTVFDALPDTAREYFALAADHSFVTDSGWFEATTPGSR